MSACPICGEQLRAGILGHTHVNQCLERAARGWQPLQVSLRPLVFELVLDAKRQYNDSAAVGKLLLRQTGSASITASYGPSPPVCLSPRPGCLPTLDYVGFSSVTVSSTESPSIGSRIPLSAFQSTHSSRGDRTRVIEGDRRQKTGTPPGALLELMSAVLALIQSEPSDGRGSTGITLNNSHESSEDEKSDGSDVQATYTMGMDDRPGIAGLASGADVTSPADELPTEPALQAPPVASIARATRSGPVDLPRLSRLLVDNSSSRARRRSAVEEPMTRHGHFALCDGPLLLRVQHTAQLSRSGSLTGASFFRLSAECPPPEDGGWLGIRTLTTTCEPVKQPPEAPQAVTAALDCGSVFGANKGRSWWQRLVSALRCQTCDVASTDQAAHGSAAASEIAAPAAAPPVIRLQGVYIPLSDVRGPAKAIPSLTPLHRAAADGQLELLQALVVSCGAQSLLLRTRRTPALRFMAPQAPQSQVPPVPLAFGHLTVLDVAILCGQCETVSAILSVQPPSVRLSMPSRLHALHYAVLAGDVGILRQVCTSVVSICSSWGVVKRRRIALVKLAFTEGPYAVDYEEMREVPGAMAALLDPSTDSEANRAAIDALTGLADSADSEAQVMSLVEKWNHEERMRASWATRPGRSTGEPATPPPLRLQRSFGRRNLDLHQPPDEGAPALSLSPRALPIQHPPSTSRLSAAPSGVASTSGTVSYVDPASPPNPGTLTSAAAASWLLRQLAVGASTPVDIGGDRLGSPLSLNTCLGPVPTGYGPLDIPDRWGRTPLAYAVALGSVDAARYLLRRKCCAAATDSAGDTLLTLALRGGQLAIALLLLVRIEPDAVAAAREAAAMAPHSGDASAGVLSEAAPGSGPQRVSISPSVSSGLRGLFRTISGTARRGEGGLEQDVEATSPTASSGSESPVSPSGDRSYRAPDEREFMAAMPTAAPAASSGQGSNHGSVPAGESRDSEIEKCGRLVSAMIGSAHIFTRPTVVPVASREPSPLAVAAEIFQPGADLSPSANSDHLSPDSDSDWPRVPLDSPVALFTVSGGFASSTRNASRLHFASASRPHVRLRLKKGITGAPDDVDVSQALAVAAHCKPTAVNKAGETALLLAARAVGGPHQHAVLDVLQLLVDIGVPRTVSAGPHRGAPGPAAAASPGPNPYRQLLEDVSGETALHAVAKRGCLPAVRILCLLTPAEASLVAGLPLAPDGSLADDAVAIVSTEEFAPVLASLGWLPLEVDAAFGGPGVSSLPGEHTPAGRFAERLTVLARDSGGRTPADCAMASAAAVIVSPLLCSASTRILPCGQASACADLLSRLAALERWLF